MEQDIILNFIGSGTGDGRRRSHLIGRHYLVRIRYWKDYGFPKEVAEYLAGIGTPVYPRSPKDKAIKIQLKELKGKWADLVGIFRERGMTRKEAENQALEILAEKNEEYKREKYNIFTLGSP